MLEDPNTDEELFDKYVSLFTKALKIIAYLVH